MSLPAWPDPITTARLRLWPIRSDDTGALVEIMWCERARLRPAIRVGESRAELVAHVAELVAACAAGSERVYVIRLGDTVVGCAGLRSRGEHPTLMLWYWLRAEHTRHGFASEAAAALCDAIPEDVEWLEIWCRASNVESARLAHRLGFVRNGVADTGGARLELWRAERPFLLARGAVRRAIVGVAAVVRDEGGTLHADDARITIGAVDGQPYVVAVSDIGDENAHDARASLVHNTTLAVGALGIVGERLVLRYAAPLPAITNGTMQLFFHEASRLRQLAFPACDYSSLALSAYFTD